MTNRLAVGALMGALMLVASGCTSDECTDQFDCNNNKGSAGEGKVWACVQNKCEARDSTTPPPPPPPPLDAGTEPDAGTDPEPEPDAGTDPGPGDMTVEEGGACTKTASCVAGQYCNSVDSKCAPLHIAVTAGPTGNATEPYSAVVVPYNKPVAPKALSEDAAANSRFPRWNPTGTAVAFEQIEAAGAHALVARAIPFVEGTPLTTLTTSAAASNTTEFRYMEWEPSNTAAWCTTSGNTTSGIWSYTSPGPAVQATQNGVFPSWAADGNGFAYSASGLGLLKKTSLTADAVKVGESTTAEQPLHNRANGVLLFLDATAIETSVGSLYNLHTIDSNATSTTGPVPVNDIALSRDERTTNEGVIRSYIANHTWAPGGTHAAYVRVYYFKSTTGDVVLCSGSNCGGQQGNVIFVRRVDTTTGAAVGEELKLADEATLPSFSPDSQFIAYLSGSQLRVQKIDPAATTEGTFKVGLPISHNWSGSAQRVLSNRGDDHRPRWQPR